MQLYKLVSSPTKLTTTAGEAISLEAADSDSRDNKELAASLHRYKETIALLGRTVQELSQVTTQLSFFSPYTKNNTSDSYKHHSFIFPPTVAYYYQEVNDTVEERVVLEYQLEQLKTIGHSDLSD